MKIVTFFFVISAATLVFGQQYNLDLTKAKVSFFFHGEKVNGTMTGVKASVNINKDKPENSVITGTVDVKTIETGNKTRNKHLTSDEYFDVAKFPTISFKSIGVKKENDAFVVTGKFKIKNVEREEKLTLTITNGMLTFRASINSADYGIMKKKTRAESQVDITIEIPFV